MIGEEGTSARESVKCEVGKYNEESWFAFGF